MFDTLPPPLAVPAHVPMPVADPAFASDILRGLRRRPKRIASKWLYDATGSALFERVTRAPGYYPARLERRILRENAEALAGLVPPGGALVELGAGAGRKTRMLLNAGGHIGSYVPLDICRTTLARSSAALGARYPGLPILPVAGDFTAAVDLPEAVAHAPKVGFFPGTTIGNLAENEAISLLRAARAWSGARAFVLGADLVSDPEEMRAAYDDPQGINRAFILNLVDRIGRDAWGTFEANDFRHEVEWNRGRSRIEISLAARRRIDATVAGRPVSLRPGERIEIATARKFTPQTLGDLASASGWRLGRLLTDPRRSFAVAVLVADDAPMFQA